MARLEIRLDGTLEGLARMLQDAISGLRNLETQANASISKVSNNISNLNRNDLNAFRASLQAGELFLTNLSNTSTTITANISSNIANINRLDIAGFRNSLEAGQISIQGFASGTTTLSTTISQNVANINRTNLSGFTNALQIGTLAVTGLNTTMDTTAANVGRFTSSFNRVNLSGFTQALRTGTLSIGNISNSLASNAADVGRFTAAFNSVNMRTFQNSLSNGQISLRQFGTQAQQTANQLSRNMPASANQASMSLLNLGRVAQDAPFGFIGIANNLNPLLESFQRLRETTGSNSAALRALGSSLMGPAGLGVALSLVTAALSFAQLGMAAWTRGFGAGKKATEDATSANRRFVESIDAITRAQLTGTQAAQKDLTNLKLLFSAYQDGNVPLKERKSAYDQLQNLYPSYFGNLKFEKEASDATKIAYDKLTSSILASARARAAADLIAEKASKKLLNEEQILNAEAGIKRNINSLKTREAFNKNAINDAKKLDDIRAGQIQKDAATTSLLAIQDRIAKANANQQAYINKRKVENFNITKDILRLEKLANAEMAKGGVLTGNLGGKKEKAAKTPKAVKDPLLNELEGSAQAAALAGLQGVDSAVEKVRQKYAALYAAIAAESAKKGADRVKLEAQFLQAQLNEGKEIGALIVQERARVENETQRIRNESGIKAAESRAKELAQVQKWYDDEVVKAQGNAQLLTTIEEGRTFQMEAINNKYIQKRLDAENKLFDKIQTIAQKDFTQNTSQSTKVTAQIESELQKRLKAIQDHFAELKKLYKDDALGLAALNIQQVGAVNTATAAAGKAKNPVAQIFDNEVRGSVQRFGTDFVRILSGVNQMADKSFANILGSLGQSLTATMNDVFLKQFQGSLKRFMDKTDVDFKQLGLSLAGILGSVVSGIAPKTSFAGQGIGGALTGAATGAVAGSVVPGIGTVVGGIIGGAVGLIGGLFGAGKARKQEALQKRQLAEQEKQTKLLERANSLAYTTSIIGKNTTQGVITQIDANAFGELTARVSGRDLVFAIDKERKAQERGR